MSMPPQPSSTDLQARRRECRLLSNRPAARIAIAAAALVLVLAGCGNSADPESWQDAEEHEFTDPVTLKKFDSAVEFNFMHSCLLANSEDSGGDLDAERARMLCKCSFDGLRQELTLPEFKSLDKALRETPNPSDLDEEPEDLWDDRAETILKGCAPRGDA